MKKNTLFLIVVFLCFTTCKKEDTTEDPFYSPTLISQINSGDLAVHGFTYNSNYLIHESTEPYTYKKYSYDAQKILIKVESANSFSLFNCAMIPGQSLETDPRKAKITAYSEFEYDNSLRLIKKSNYFINNATRQLTSYHIYEYENDMIVKLSTYNPQGKLTEYHNYSYDYNGNMTRDDQFISTPVIQLVNTKIFEFDNKNNPYRVFASEGDPGLYTNKNNIITETSISYHGTDESRSTKLHTYEYNSLDFPVKIDKLDCLYGK
jgi:hypothetical protein